VPVKDDGEARLAAARRLYDGFAARDAVAIRDALSEDFVGDVSAGMPLGVGGRHEGRDAMLRDVWMKVFGAYDMRVEAEDFHVAGDDVVVAVGAYRGVERASGRDVEAGFAHVLTVREGRVTALRQITDTERWRVGAT
jgi:ketosteroid isomerase-like protein